MLENSVIYPEVLLRPDNNVSITQAGAMMVSVTALHRGWNAIEIHRMLPTVAKAETRDTQTLKEKIFESAGHLGIG